MQGKNLLNVLVACFLGLAALSANAQRTPVPVVDYVNESWPRPDGKQLSSDQVRQAIRAAIQEHRAEGKFPWQVEPASDGNLLATVGVRNKHIVRVTVSNTATSFSVVYQGSSDLKAAKTPEGWVIHPFYNRWAGDLVKAIKEKLSRT
jgi:hypothetical protein